MPVGAGKILGPEGDADVPVEIAVTVTVERAGRIHQARESPLGFFAVIGRQGNIAD